VVAAWKMGQKKNLTSQAIGDRPEVILA